VRGIEIVAWPHKYIIGGHVSVVEAMKMPSEAVRVLIKAVRVSIAVVGVDRGLEML
jgi:hypothetical protein